MDPDLTLRDLHQLIRLLVVHVESEVGRGEVVGGAGSCQSWLILCCDDTESVSQSQQLITNIGLVRRERGGWLWLWLWLCPLY